MRRLLTVSKVLATPRRRALLAALAAIALAATACVQQNTTYPVEIFKEMHYAQFHHQQEPPRQDPVADNVTFLPAGGPDGVLNVPERRERPYDAARAAELYRVNCSVCHGVNGEGNGPAAPHITSTESFYASQNNGTTYPAPPNLLQSRERLTEDTAFQIVNNGINVMPRFGGLMPEEDIWDVVRYIFDTSSGLGTR